MEKCSRVYEFDNGCEADVVLAFVLAAACAQQHQYRAHTLAACINDVVANAFDQGDVRIQLVDYYLIYGFEIGRDNREDLFVHEATVVNAVVWDGLANLPGERTRALEQV
jgi:hypothetical protein